MRLPDTVTLQRAAGTDAYGDPAADWTNPTSKSSPAFVLYRTGHEAKAFLPAGTDVRQADRLIFSGATYEVTDARTLRSPSRAVLVAADLKRLSV